jgi:hypothetical protein
MEHLASFMTGVIDWALTRSLGKLFLIAVLGLPILAVVYLVFPKTKRNTPTK